MQASAASACLRKLSDWVYSQSNPHADSRFNMLAYLFSLAFRRLFWMILMVTSDFYIDNYGSCTAKLLSQLQYTEMSALAPS